MRRMLSLHGSILVLFATAWPQPVRAIPVFAHRFGLSCQACHTAVPHLTPYGEAFLANGYRLPQMRERGVLPLAVKANLAYSSEPDPTGLPKAVVDEIEVLSGGAVTDRISYFAETYLVDGGRPGAIRDLCAAYRLPAPMPAHVPITLTGGQFTLPLPVDPETFRETSTHYAVFDQRIGTNPFNFFEPKIGAQARFGSDARGTSLTLAGLQGHDKQSGIGSDGTDRMLYAQHVAGPVIASAYRYDGTRPLQPAADRFWRQGYGLSYVTESFTLDAVLQNGLDTSADGTGSSVRSSGGFIQARYAFVPGFFGLVRYDGTSDSRSGPARSLLVGAGMRVRRNSRLTVEDVIGHSPRTTHALSATLLFAY